MAQSLSSQQWASILRAGLDAADRKAERSVPPKTDTLPGTPEKLAVLCQRHRAGLQLWNRDEDPRWEQPSGGEKEDTISLGIKIEVRGNGAPIHLGTEIERAMHEVDDREDTIDDEIAADLAASRSRQESRAAILRGRTPAA